MNKNEEYQKACLSSLLHDLRTAQCCINFHRLNPFNDFSKKYKPELDAISLTLKNLYDKVSLDGSPFSD